MLLESHARDRMGPAQACGMPALTLPAFPPMDRHCRAGARAAVPVRRPAPEAA